jgi:RHS repeat-associated protein
MRNKTNIIVSIILILSFLQITDTFSQIKIDQAPGEVQVQNSGSTSTQELNVSGGVDLFTGQYQQAINLGSVAAFGGINYSLVLSYASSGSVSTDLPSMGGLPYGLGWNLSLPTIQVESSGLNKYSPGEIESLMLQDNPIPFTLTEARNEGKLFWYRPRISIPGIYSGRLILKEIRNNDYIFIPVSFENYFEAKLVIPTNEHPYWQVSTSNGEVYEFKKLTFNHTSSVSQRVSNQNAEDLEVQKNMALPKTTFNTWYCTRIFSTNHTIDEIKFYYSDYFASPYDGLDVTNIAEIKSYFSLSTTFNTLVNQEVLLDSVASNKESLILDYNTFVHEFSDYNIQNNHINFNTLYYKDIKYQAGSNPSESWRMYLHSRSSTIMNCHALSDGDFEATAGLIDIRNPYSSQLDQDLFSEAPNSTCFSYKYKQSTFNAVRFYEKVPDGSDDKYDAGFIESPIVALNNFVPGDLYQLKVTIPEYADRKMWYDVNILGNISGYNDPVGTLQIPNLLGNTDYKYIFSKNIDFANVNNVYSTINNQIKRDFAHKNDDGHNFYFTAQNKLHVFTDTIISYAQDDDTIYVKKLKPRSVDGYKIQIGPSSSDHIHHKFPLTNGNSADINNQACSFYPDLLNIVGYREGYSIKQNFGIGAPNYLLRNYYKNSGFCDDITPPLKYWYRPIQGGRGCTETNVQNRPTYYSGINVDRLSSVVVTRIGKKPYVLRRVRKLVKNANGTGKIFKNNIHLAYTNKKTERVSPISANGFRNQVLLSEIVQLDTEIEMAIPDVLPGPNPPNYDENFWNTIGCPGNCFKWQFRYNKQVVNADIELDEDGKNVFNFSSNKLFLNSDTWMLSEIINPTGKITKLTYKPTNIQVLFSYLDNYSQFILRTPSTNTQSYLKANYRVRQYFPITHGISSQPFCGQKELWHGLKSNSYTLVFVVDTLKEIIGGQLRYQTYAFQNFTTYNDRFYHEKLEKNFINSDLSGFSLATVLGFVRDGNQGIKTETTFHTNYPLIGKTINTKIYDVGNVLKEETIYDYSAVNKFTACVTCDHPDFKTINQFYDVAKFYESRYAINSPSTYLNSYFIKLNSTIRKLYETSGTLTQNTDFTYYDGTAPITGFYYGFLLKTKSVENSTSTLTTEYKYAHQIGDAGAIAMRPKNMISIPLETLVNNGTGGGSKTEFASFNGSILYPFKEYSYGTRDAGTYCTTEQTGNWVLRKKYNTYNAFALPINITTACQAFPEVFTAPEDLYTSKTFGSRTESFEYDNLRRLKKKTAFDDMVEEYTYDRFDRPQTIITKGATSGIFKTKIFSYRNSHSEYTYGWKESGLDYVDSIRQNMNQEGNVLAEVIFNATANGNTITNTNQYDHFGRRTQYSTPLSATGNAIVTYEPNHLNRPSTLKPAGSQQTILYNYGVNSGGEIAGYGSEKLTRVQETDENGNIMYTYSDMLGNKVAERRPVTTELTGASPEAITIYTYNDRQQVTGITTPANQAYSYTYYNDGLLKTKTLPGGLIYTYEYNNKNLLSKTTYPSGEILTVLYNDYNDPLTYTWEGSTVQTVQTIQYYAQNSGITAGKMQSQTLQAGSNSDTHVFNFTLYDQYGRVLNSNEIFPDGATVQKTHQINGRSLPTMTTGNYSLLGAGSFTISESVGYGGDYMTPVSESFQVGTTSVSSSTAYNSSNWMTGRTLGGGLFHSGFSYHPKGLIKGLNYVSNGGQSTPSCSPPDIRYDCLKPWSVLNPIVRLDYYIQQDTVRYGNLIMSYQLVDDNIMSNRADTIFLHIDENFVVPLIPNYNRLYQGNFNGMVINNENINEAADSIGEDLDALLRGADPIIRNPVVVVDKVDREIIRIPIRSVCDTLIYAELAELFSQKLTYEDGNAVVNAPPQYNGNISTVTWQILWGERQVYGYKYDQLNRLKDATYAAMTQDGGYILGNRFTVNISEYDHDGNMHKISRHGINGTCPTGYNFGEIDLLNMSYSNGKLSSVSEGASTEYGYAYSGGGIGYDANGNVNSMTDRGISSITYDWNHLPKLATYTNGAIQFVYNAAGQKLAQIKTGAGAETLRYYDRIVVKNGVVSSIEGSAGNLKWDASQSKFVPQYYIKDYLGHIRLVVEEKITDGTITANEVIQSTDYYPFGMRIKNHFQRPTNGIMPIRYGLSGNEEEPTLGLMDFNARWYDPAFGKFLNVDPLAEQMAGWGMYRYAFNNPISNIDPNGMIPVDGDDWYKNNETGEVHWQSGSNDIEGHTNIGSDYIFDGPKHVIFHKQNEVVGIFDKSQSIDNASLSVSAAVMYGGGIELGQFSDGNTVVPYITLKHGFGVAASASIGVGKSVATQNSGISYSHMSGSGGENSLGIGPLGYSFSSDRASSEFGAHSNPSLYRTHAGSIGVGFPFELTGFSTKTYIGKPYKIDKYSTLRLKMSGL